jgi:hypothetical protein
MSATTSMGLGDGKDLRIGGDEAHTAHPVRAGGGTTPDSEIDLRTQHLSRDVTLEGQTPYGQKYSIRATLVGPSGSSADVVSVWIVRTGEELPRFVTAYPEAGR